MKWLYIGKDQFACLDDEDFEKAKHLNWYLTAVGYPAARHLGKKIAVYLHRFIMGSPPFPELQYVDHVNRNKLDNRRANLRWVSPHESARNTHRAKSTYSKQSNKWRVRVWRDWKEIHVGLYETQAEADRVGNAVLKVLGMIFDETNITSEATPIPEPLEREKEEAIGAKLLAAQRNKERAREMLSDTQKKRYAEGKMKHLKHAPK